MYRIAGVRHHKLGVILESLYDFQGTRMGRCRKDLLLEW